MNEPIIQYDYADSLEDIRNQTFGFQTIEEAIEANYDPEFRKLFKLTMTIEEIDECPAQQT